MAWTSSQVTERGIENEDIVEIDLAAQSGSGDLKSLSGKHVVIEVGKGQISQEFDKQILGLTRGATKKFDVKLPESHPVKEAAGRPVTFTATAKKISKKELPPLGDDFAKQISGAPSYDAFKGDVVKRLTEDKKLRVEADVKNKLLEKAAGGVSADIPEGMIRRETDVMIDELKSSLMRDRLTLEDYLKLTKKTEESLRAEMKSGAQMRVMSKLCLRAVALKEKLEVTGEDLEEEIKALSRSSSEDPEKFKKNIRESGIEFIKDYLLRRKALEYIMSNAKVKYKKEVLGKREKG